MTKIIYKYTVTYHNFGSSFIKIKFCCDQGTNERKVNSGRVYSAYIWKPGIYKQE